MLIMVYLNFKEQNFLKIKMKISLITSTHFSFDDRIYHHMAISLLKKGHEVQLISSFSQNVENIDENIFDRNDG